MNAVCFPARTHYKHQLESYTTLLYVYVWKNAAAHLSKSPFTTVVCAMLHTVHKLLQI